VNAKHRKRDSEKENQVFDVVCSKRFIVLTYQDKEDEIAQDAIGDAAKS